MGNDWFHEYFINELKAIGRMPTSNMQHEVVDSLPSSGNEQTIYFVKNDSSSSNNHYDEYVWISSSSTFEKIGSTQIDGSTTQPDWNQNDRTASDYVKNRPFYTGDPVETVLVEESTVAFEDGEGIYVAEIPTTFAATVGETYKISWDGTVYECTCGTFDEVHAIGNLSIAGGSDTGEPFLILVMNDQGIQIATADTSASHTISISRTVVPVVKIDKKYLVQPDWNQNDETAADYVKNRPFYTGDPTRMVLVEETTVPFSDSGDGSYIGAIESTSVPTIGETYKVTWDGIDYECTCINSGGNPMLGDINILFGEHDPSGEPFLIGSLKSKELHIIAVDTSASHTLSISSMMIVPVVKIDEKYLPDTLMSFKPTGKSYLTFSSPSSFTLAVNDATKHWNGTLEYFASDKTWTTWDGNSILSSVSYYGEYVLYLRGTGNTVLTGSNRGYNWVLTGTDIECIGNIENLLDYAAVESGEHPIMANYCYSFMFDGCTSLIHAPDLLATTLAEHCYSSMFRGCTSLTHAPALPATTLANQCYSFMFDGCTSLTHAPDLLATTLAEYCCYYMFRGCTSLTHAPALPATTLANQCYSFMFDGCTSLTHAPDLLATTLAEYCCYFMFQGCTSLTHAPALPATTLADSCYSRMFKGCKNLTHAPALPATTLAVNCYSYMFDGCTSLKLSSTKTDEYTQEYRIPSSGNGTTAANALNNMFSSTGGTFTGGPKINTTYYLSSDNMIVRETELATLNGYVGSMINTALSKIGIAEEGAY